MLVAIKGDESREVIRHQRGVWWCPFDDNSNQDTWSACGKCGAVSSDEEAEATGDWDVLLSIAAGLCRCNHGNNAHNSNGQCQYRRHCGCEAFQLIQSISEVSND